MPIFTDTSFMDIPLSLYVHIPWCVRKCPYCDFNSHQMKAEMPEDLYVEALLSELDLHLPLIRDRSLISIFFGGGTPSLFSGIAIEKILRGVRNKIKMTPDIEITLEANPGTVDQARFREFRDAGINRLSLGIQSLQDDKLLTLGRIHNKENAMRAIELAKSSGFDNFNLDLMFGLPNQSIEDALHDLQTAIHFSPTHLSWYQLTIEPNTLFYHQRPTLPADDLIWDMQTQGQQLLANAGFKQYEISAYARDNLCCKHNLNYWEYGDYLGIGAGAHSKITDINNGIRRFAQVKNPRDYLLAAKRNALQLKTISDKEVIFEFMLNALRLTNGVPKALFSARTGISLDQITPLLTKAKSKNLLSNADNFIQPTDLGKRFLNDLIELFLP